LFPGYTNEVREQSKAYLYVRNEPAYHKLTAIEEPLVSDFGMAMAQIIKDILRQWAQVIRERLRNSPELRPIREKEQVGIIMDFLRMFESEYESKFGKMEDNFSGSLGEVKHNTIYIRSTAYGTKVFLGLLMADRLHVIDRKRRDERERIGFEEMVGSELAEDSKNCPICQEVMGVQSPEGQQETPIKLVVCCGQVFGNLWYVALRCDH
jgi:hypothetical protein